MVYTSKPQLYNSITAPFGCGILYNFLCYLRNGSLQNSIFDTANDHVRLEVLCVNVSLSVQSDENESFFGWKLLKNIVFFSLSAVQRDREGLFPICFPLVINLGLLKVKYGSLIDLCIQHCELSGA